MGDLTENFSRAEFACHCGCGFDDISENLINVLQHLRNALDEPIHILSGCRCTQHNAICGGVKDSQHLKGNAADIVVVGLSPDSLADLLETNFKIGGIGIYPRFVHIDVRKTRARWRK